ncbi:MAG: DNA alkylation repair protein [Kiritimatiellae bacterium]|jgi:3-methyladenine DNA glycosylase AlkD|nr:DNA alkylation repair protein [Kiritimatiellia bacterium]MDD4342101.1 DNA alkylation repair protein [Kiritimatiellia bacterium]MDY0148694.1 DNA alkylation repair protein [Kiritimatiellia bacterium]
MIKGSGRATTAAVWRELKRQRNPDQAAILRRFFKTAPGDYGAGDEFWGLKVPQIRAILAQFQVVPLAVADDLLASTVHEARFFALVALLGAYRQGGKSEKQAIYDFYLARRQRVNNWDLVDVSAPGIVGRHLPVGGGRSVLARLAASPSLWSRRIAMVATLDHIRRGHLANTFWLAPRVLDDPEDLMHKATGWMLREAGKRDEAALEAFLSCHAPRMPRTMLRYAIERLPPDRRRAWLAVPSLMKKTPRGTR